MSSGCELWRRLRIVGIATIASGLVGIGAASAAESAPPAAATPAAATSAAATSAEQVDTDALYAIGKQLFEQFAPPEVKAEYEFVSKEEWDALAARLQGALQSDAPGALEELAGYAQQARGALTALRLMGADPGLADWLEQRIDELEAAGQVQPSKPVPPATPETVPPKPTPKPTPKPSPKPAAPAIPHFDLWMSRVRDRPMPSRAAELMPTLRAVFSSEGVPPELAWIAEAESSLNPNARSPAGAKGLFQLMPDTARRLGLGTFMPDERTHPEKSARAAARYLKELHGRFGNWPLALAAYNAGEGRVSRALTAKRAKDFAGIATTLPAETRMYVPKVCALIEVRAGKPVSAL